MLPDLIVSWPDAFDFPLFRKFLKENAYTYFNHVFLVMTKTNHQNIDARSILKAQFEDMAHRIIIYDAPGTQPDWRDDAITSALIRSSSDFVLFMEQDFEIYNQRILDEVKRLTDTVLGKFVSEFKFYGFKQGERIHPAFLLVHTGSVLHQLTHGITFAPNPGVSDHFDDFTTSLAKVERFVSLEELEFVNGIDFSHMNGLTHNLYLESIGQPITYDPQEFALYKERIQGL